MSGRSRSENTIGSARFLALPLLVLLVPLLACCHENTSQETLESAYPSELHYSTRDPTYQSYPCMPRGLHMAQADDSAPNGTVSVYLSFRLNYVHCKTVHTTITYGMDKSMEETMTLTVPLHTRTQFNYTSALSNGTFQSDWIYHVRLGNIQAGLFMYWYQIRVDEPRGDAMAADDSALPERRLAVRTLGVTQVHHFRTPPLPHQPTSVALVGDLGQTYNSMSTMAHIWRATENEDDHSADYTETSEPPVSHILIAGDLSYADHDPLRWPRWMDLMEPFFRSVLLHTVPGNHEIEHDNVTWASFIPYDHYFRNPNRVEALRDLPDKGDYNFANSFYAYEHGLAKIIVLNSYSDSSSGSYQYIWLESELNRFDRTRTPWLVVSFHAPLYTTFEHHYHEIDPVMMQSNMEHLFVKYGVNFVVSGHDHAYMRTTSLKYGNVDATGKAPVYLILGAGGNREPLSTYRLVKPEPWIVKRDNTEYGYGRLFLANATSARLRWIRDDPKTFTDDVWLSNVHA